MHVAVADVDVRTYTWKRLRVDIDARRRHLTCHGVERRLTPEGVQIFTVANFAKSTTGKIFDLARQKMIWQTKSLLAD